MKTIATAAVSGLLALGSATALAQENDLLGLWGSETTFAPALQGELTLRRSGPIWRASIGGAESQCTAEAGTMRCQFSQNRGL
jgi:poly(3-hydroxybutyrate) depolymerase